MARANLIIWLTISVLAGPGWSSGRAAPPKIFTLHVPRQVLTTDGLLRADVLIHETRRILRNGSTDPRLMFFPQVVFLLMDKPYRPRTVRQIMKRVADSRDPRIERLVYFTLGLADLAEGKLDEAVRHFDLAAWGPGSSPVARLNLAHLAIITHQPWAAIEVLGAAPIPAFKNYSGLARYHLARAYALLWKVKPAMAMLEEAFLEPGDPPRLRQDLPVPPAFLDKDPALNILRVRRDFKDLVALIKSMWAAEKARLKPPVRRPSR
jgi:hypothetical protein